MRLCFLPALLCLITAGSAARADSTYNVNLSLGGATATGFITTDGVTGTLKLSDITGFQLTLNGGGNAATFDEVSGNAGFQDAGDGFLTATTTGLFVNFGGDPTDALYFYDSLNNDLCFSNDATFCTSGLSGPVSVITVGNQDYVGGSSTGVQQIAGVQTPEPTSFALLGTGALALVSTFRRRFV